MSYFIEYDSFGTRVKEHKSFTVTVIAKDGGNCVSSQIPMPELDTVMAEVDAVVSTGIGISVWDHAARAIMAFAPGTISRIEVQFKE
ncbi:hypothetical protein M0R04_14915 [Candidatus Dojkabacteria bacterium]|jgi:hypothetical protein|nr:hypothetical protein [Candidatus Dojkabacteria bacterium]